jgi:hypothetical protein
MSAQKKIEENLELEEFFNFHLKCWDKIKFYEDLDSDVMDLVFKMYLRGFKDGELS